MPAPELFLLFTRRLNELGARYMVTGSVAATIYGEPRLTNDVDIVLVLDQKDITRLLQLFPLSEFYCPPVEVLRVEAGREQRGHFTVIHQESGFKADFYLSGHDPLHAWGLARAKKVDFAGEALALAAPEYVIIRKLEYVREGGSEKHLRDIRSILAASSDLIDFPELEKHIGQRGLQDAWAKVQSGLKPE